LDALQSAPVGPTLSNVFTAEKKDTERTERKQEAGQ
jgi:hypothetical protein